MSMVAVNAGTGLRVVAVSGSDLAVDEALLLDLLNTTPTVDGVRLDGLGDPDAARRWLAEHGQAVPASALDAASAATAAAAATDAAPGDEWHTLIEARAALQDVVRGDRPASALAPYLADVAYRADVTDEGVTWRLDAPKGRAAAAKAVLAWDTLRVSSPGRLRPCANDECSLFLIDHSKPNTARWCSMAVCGNRMKARRHYQRNRDASV